MFYDRFLELCSQKGVKPGRACLEMGLSRSLAAKWKAEKTERPSIEALDARKEELKDQIAYQELHAVEEITRDDIVALLYLFRDGDVDDKLYQEKLFDAFLVRAYVYGDSLRLLFSVFGDETEVDVKILEGVRISAPEAHHVVLYEHTPETITMVTAGLFLISCRI